MQKRFGLSAAILALTMAMALTPRLALSQQRSLPEGIEKRPYMGWPESLILDGDLVQAIVVPAIGGRITHYSLNGENIIYEIPESAGKTLANTKTNFSVGGYQCDIGPEIRGIPPHPALWMGAHSWQASKAHTLKLASPVEIGLQIDKEILIEPDSGDLGITQRLRNVSGQSVSYCLWDRTLCKGGGFAFFPLNKRSRFPARWSLRREVDGKYLYDGQSPASPNVKVFDNLLVAKCSGPATKLGADSDAGWIAYARGKVLFVKFYPYFPEGKYTDGGNSVEVYFDEPVGELEPLSPEIQLQPGENYSFPEMWTLIELEKEVTSHEQVRGLLKKIPPSPFKR
jgi:hypothetical protein